MTVGEYNDFCRALPHTTHVVQWGGAHVWKVAGKVFAIAWDEPGDLHVTFKVSDLGFDVMREMPGLRPAPYLASRGMKWIQRTGPGSLDDDGLRDYLAESHRIVASGLAKRLQKELGIGAYAAGTASSPTSRVRRSASDSNTGGGSRTARRGSP